MPNHPPAPTNPVDANSSGGCFRFGAIVTPIVDMSELLTHTADPSATVADPAAAPACDPEAATGPPALFALMARQHGVASCQQSRELGVSRAVERRLIREGALREPLAGVLAAGGMRASYSSQAMAATVIPGALALSHGAAARVHRLAGWERHPTLDVVGQRGAHLRTNHPVVSHYTRGPVADHLVNVGALTVTSIPLTLVLIAAECSTDRLRTTLHDAVRRGIRVSAITDVLGDWQVGGRAGTHRLAAVLAELLTTSATPPVDLREWRRRRSRYA